MEFMDNYFLIGDIFIWFFILFYVVVVWIFYIMECIGCIGENFFEGMVNDVFIFMIVCGIEIDFC